LTATSDLVEFNLTREIRGIEKEGDRERERGRGVARFAFVSPLTRRARNTGQDIASIFKRRGGETRFLRGNERNLSKGAAGQVL